MTIFERLAGAALAFSLTFTPALAQPKQSSAEKTTGEIGAEAPSPTANNGAGCALEDKSQCVGSDQIVDEIQDWVFFFKNKEEIPGFFKFYRDTETGELFMEIAEDQFGEEFIYFSYTQDGTRREGMRMAGMLNDNSVLTLRRRYRHVDVIQKSTDYVVDEASTLTRSPGANITDPILASLEVATEDPMTGRVVVRANDLFMTNALVRLGRLSALGRAFGATPGTLNARKTNIRSVRAYKDNVEVTAEYVYDWKNAATPSTSSATTTVQHTFLRMPGEGFEPRRADPRVGYFIERRTNLSRIDGNPAEDYIQHWRLEKKDPEADVSDVVKPITFWISNTTPEAYRDVVRDAVLSWNPLFEEAGFSNAIAVKVQPDDADWDAGDVRYNVIRWMSSPAPIFSGYGPRYSNPRTGEILGADIVIEHSIVQRWLRTDRMLVAPAGDIAAGAVQGEAATHGAAQDWAEEAASGFGGLPPLHEELCEAGAHMAMSQRFARLAAVAATSVSPDAAVSEQIVREGLAYVVAHEVGHVLGLTHNMMGAYYTPLDALNGASGDEERRLTASIMDYPGVNVAPDRSVQDNFFQVGPGAYDSWAIRFGYGGDMDEEAVRRSHLARSTESGHAFANDADAMHAPGVGMDPRVSPYSLSSDPIAFASRQAEVIRAAMDNLIAATAREGQSWEETRQSFELLMGMWMQSANVMSRFVGGVYSDQSVVGQEGAAGAPLRPVPAEEQRRAIEAMGQYLFSDEAFAFPTELVAHLQPERRGFDAYGRVTEPLLQSWVSSVQRQALAHALHPRVLNRLTDSLSYGGDYSTLAMLGDLNREIFDGPRPGVYRRNLQIAYVDRLIRVRDYHGLARAPAVAVDETLRRIERMNHGVDFWMDAETRAHRRYIRERIKQSRRGQD